MPTLNNNTNVTNNNTNGGNNMNTFTMEELAAALSNAMVEAQTRMNAQTPAPVVERVTVETQGDGRAVHSRLYNSVLTDGTIFNPYICRRFLPAQFLKLMKKHNGNVDRGIKKTYDYKFMMKWMLSEVNKLAYLEKYDKVAFTERKNFLTIPKAKVIIKDYCRQLRKALEDSRNGRYSNKIGVDFWANCQGFHFLKGQWEEVIENHRVVRKLKKSDEYKRILNKIKYLENDVTRCRTYKELSSLLGGFKFIFLKKGDINWAMMDAFKGSGAYFTLKNLILFENVGFYSTTDGNFTNPVEASNALKGIANRDAYVIYAILKKSIEDSNYEI